MVILAHSGSEKRVPLSVFNQEHTQSSELKMKFYLFFFKPHQKFLSSC